MFRESYSKTDLIDAAVIAHFAEATKPKVRQMPDEVTRLLADLVARRRQIVEMIAAEAQRTRRMSDKRLTKSVARLRKALDRDQHGDQLGPALPGNRQRSASQDGRAQAEGDCGRASRVAFGTDQSERVHLARARC